MRAIRIKERPKAASELHMEDPRMLWRLPPNWNVPKEHIPADWDWFVQVSSPNMIGKLVGLYQITATSNEATNANGQSYRATDTRTGSAVALKLLSYWLAEDSLKSAHALERCHLEARSFSALNHRTSQQSMRQESMTGVRT